MRSWRHWNDRRKLGFAGGALLLALVLVFGWRTSSRGTIRLADGARLSFQGLSVGMDCSRFYGSALSRLAQSLSADLGRYFPEGTTIRHTLFETNMVFWMQCDRAIPHQDRVRFSLVDPQGRMVSLRLPFSAQTLRDGSVAVSAASPVWPRDAAKFVLQVHDADLATSNQLAGRWEIWNPSPVARAAWTAEPLPVRRSIGGASVLLEHFETRPMPVMRSRLARTNEVENLGFLDFQWTSLDPNSPPGVLADLRLHDAAGNVTSWLAPRPTTNRQIHVSGARLPWPGERVYLIETRWDSRQAGPGDIQGQIQAVLKTPWVAGEVSRAVGRGQFGGTEIVIQARVPVEGPTSGWRILAQTMRRKLVDPPEHAVSLAEAIDDGGRRWQADVQGEIQLPAGVESVRTTVTLRPLITLRFTAEPIQRTNSLPSRRTETR